MARLRDRATSSLALVRRAYDAWSAHKASRMAAALAFYTALSLAPLLVIVVAVAGLVYGDDAARGEIVSQFQHLLGREGAEAIQAILASSKDTGQGVVATAIGAVVLLLGASAVFGELQDSFNTIWDVPPRPGRGLRGLLATRLFSFAMVLSVAFLLLVSLVLTAALTAAGALFEGTFGRLAIVWQAINLVVAYGVTTVLFAVIFKVLPDVKVRWGDVWIGALVTAGMFTLGKVLIGVYLGRGTATSAYGAAGSLVAMLIWVYYSAQILFFGAEVAQVYASQHGSRVASRLAGGGAQVGEIT